MEKWVKEELRGLKVGDARLEKRAEKILEGMARRPEGSLPEVAGGAAEMAGIYRMMSNSSVGLEEMVGAHREAVLGRARGQQTVLCAQDTTFLNYGSQPSIQGLGRHSHEENGMLVHVTLAATEDGVVLGAVDAQTLLHRQEKRVGRSYKTKGIEDKQSMRWLKSLERLNELAELETGVEQWVSVADREADIYELFTAWRQKRVHWVIRAAYNRATVEESYLWQEMANSPVLGRLKVKVHPRPDQPEREAEMEVRASQVSLRPPRRPDRKLPEVKVWAVWAREIHTPEGAIPVEWMLLTDLPVQTFEQAAEKLRWYAQRWLIERFFYVLKSGCRVESLQLAERGRLETALGFYLIVTWRILWMTMAARVQPPLPATVALTEEEWKIAWVMVHKKPLPPSCPTLHEVVAWLAQLGGHLGKPSSKPPGPKALWRGLQQIHSVRAYQLALENV